MTVFQQMGHHAENLLDEETLCDYAGAVLSPVNYTEPETIAQISRLQVPGNFDFVFDPQFYFPETNRGVLREWSYFPADVDTADQSSVPWWKQRVTDIVDTAKRLSASFVCSPAIVPRFYSNDFYDTVVQVGEILSDNIGDATPVQTVLVNLAELGAADRAQAIGSIISRTKCRHLYLIFVTDQEPRRELTNAAELARAMLLIALLESSGLRVIVGFSSSDMVLWKAAGATSCATGKFFNLRRFTKSRFEEPAGGGGQLPYWFEESLLAYLRETDVIRIRQENLISEASLRNPHSQEILDLLGRGQGEPWLALSWRHYMCWFADMERRISRGHVDVRAMLHQVEQHWRVLEDRDVLLEEPRNDGSWIRPWRQALSDFRKLLS